MNVTRKNQDARASTESSVEGAPRLAAEPWFGAACRISDLSLLTVALRPILLLKIHRR